MATYILKRVVGSVLLLLMIMVITFFLMLFSVGVAIGSVFCGHLMKGFIHTTYTPLSALMMGVCFYLLYHLTENYPTPDMPVTLGQFFNTQNSVSISLAIFVMAFFGGLYIVPLNTLMQKSASKARLASVIGGNNIFKLRDLGDALGFQVNYDKASNTAIVISHAWSWPTKWLTQEYIYNEDGAATSHTLITYDENGMMMSYLSESEYDTYSCSYTYNEVGRTEAMVSDSVYVYHDGERFEDHTTVTYEYDIWGNLVREISESTGDVYSETSYTYDDNGNILVAETLNNYGSSATYYTYDENGRQIKVAYADNDEVMNVDEYFRDADGNIIKQVSTYGDEVSSWAEFTLVDGLVTQETWGYGEDSYTYFYTYDDNGNVIHSEYRSPYGSTVTNNIYDAQGREVQSETTYDGGSTLTVWTYDEQGNLVKYERTDSSGFYSVDETSYDEEGNILKEVSRVNGTVRTYTYTYDLEARKMTCLVVTEYEAVG